MQDNLDKILNFRKCAERVLLIVIDLAVFVASLKSLKGLFREACNGIGKGFLRHKFYTATGGMPLLIQDRDLSNACVDILPECILKEGVLQSSGSPVARKHLFSNMSVSVLLCK